MSQGGLLQDHRNFARLSATSTNGCRYLEGNCPPMDVAYHKRFTFLPVYCALPRWYTSRLSALSSQVRPRFRAVTPVFTLLCVSLTTRRCRYPARIPLPFPRHSVGRYGLGRYLAGHHVPPSAQVSAAA